MALIWKTLISMGIRVFTSAMIEWAIIEGAERLAKRTKTKFDDRLVTRLKAELKR